MKQSAQNKRGSGYLIVLAFACILLIFLMIFATVASNQQQMQSKDVRTFFGSCLAENALNCMIAELNADRGFCTHRYFSKSKGFEGPVKKRNSLLGAMQDLKINGVSKGIYSGSTSYGEFKAKAARFFGARENVKTKTLRESEMYYKVEIASKITARGGSKTDSYRKITAFLERRYPSIEHLLYDGELLDIGMLGPYHKRENQLRRARLYGQHFIMFDTAGGSCMGSELYEAEKIETPGFIRALKNTRIQFSNKTTLDLSRANDSLKPDKFTPHNGYIVDGAHGGHPVRISTLPRERIKAAAEKYKKTSGLIIKKGDLPVSAYKNPYNPSARYVDLNFGKLRRKSTRDLNPQRDSDNEDEDESEDDTTNYSSFSDDPEIIKKLTGDKLIVYSEVPLRIWGNPDRTITIYCTEDVNIAGDFNQHEKTPQLYTNEYYLDYKFKIENGKHKIGALIMSEKRVIIDISHPTLFAKNELAPYFFYCLAMALHPSTSDIEAEVKTILCPIDPDNRQSLLGLGNMGANGEFEPRYGTMKWLHDNRADSGPQYDANMEDIIAFFTPGGGDIPRFGINDADARKQIIDDLKEYIRNGGCDLTREEQQKLFDKAWAQAILEESKKPDENAGAMGLMKHLFKEAIKSPSDTIYVPEITINAFLVSSTRRASKFVVGNSKDKIDDEIGNAPSCCYLKPPAFVIQRVYGGVARLANSEPDYFISGAHTGKAVLRRRIWDNTNLTNTKFRPKETPSSHNILTFREEMISETEYNAF